MSERDPSKPSNDLEARISRAKQSALGQSEQQRYGTSSQSSNDEPSKSQQSGIGQALRMGIEMVSAIAVGTAIGWLLDYWLDTNPWFKIVFILLGAAAGMLNVYRLANGYGYAVGYQKQDQDDTKGKE